MQEKIINGHKHIQIQVKQPTSSELLNNTSSYFNSCDSRRSIREFSAADVPKEVIENIIKTASTAPSGAHKQPWTFCAISNKEIKAKIRAAAEEEEKVNYESRMSERWKQDLEVFATNWQKEFLTTAPWLIVVFKQAYGYDFNNQKQNHYYVNESVGIACGFLINAIQQAGLVTLTHTPSPMNFLADILKRPKNERPFLLLPVGYAKQPCYVPDIKRKSLEEIAVFYE